MSELIFDVDFDEEGRLLAVAQGQPIFTDGADLPELRRNVQEAVDVFFYDGPKPQLVRLHLVHNEVLAAA